MNSINYTLIFDCFYSLLKYLTLYTQSWYDEYPKRQTMTVVCLAVRHYLICKDRGKEEGRRAGGQEGRRETDDCKQ